MDYFQRFNKMLTMQYIGIYWHGSLNMDINQWEMHGQVIDYIYIYISSYKDDLIGDY